MTTPGKPIEWRRHSDVEDFVRARLEEFIEVVPPVRRWQEDWLAHASTRLIDWLDHLILADGDAARGRLAELGFEREDVPAGDGDIVYYHPGAIAPRVLLRKGVDAELGVPLAIAVGVEGVAEFLMVQGVVASVEGSPLSPYRRAKVYAQHGREVFAVARGGVHGFLPQIMAPDYAGRYRRGYERWATRPRAFEDIRLGMDRTLKLARELVNELGVDVAAWVAFAAERAYWQRRNRAGGVQKRRQDALGLGWGNHDHHTFRSSRRVFPLLIEILETFGFRPRERFYAGAEAGWGAQVMEQPVCRIAVFADVDLAPGEVSGDFAHETLAPRDDLGTVGLWCALHGESMLEAGLHHLAGRLDFDAAREDLAEERVAMMRPFSDFSYLRQAFTEGERWPVEPSRLAHLEAAGQIDAAQREKFASAGAIGSHLEDIQRGEGFKGFNQQTVSDIIKRTDPRGGT